MQVMHSAGSMAGAIEVNFGSESAASTHEHACDASEHLGHRQRTEMVPATHAASAHWLERGERDFVGALRRGVFTTTSNETACMAAEVMPHNG